MAHDHPHRTPTPRLIPMGRSVDRPRVTAWLIQPDPDHRLAFPFVVVAHSRRARLLNLCTRWRRNGGILAVTLGDVVLVAAEVPSLAVLGHEAVHVLQYHLDAKGSRLRFVWMYLRRSVKRGYLGNAWELEAMSYGPRIAAAFAAEHREAQG